MFIWALELSYIFVILELLTKKQLQETTTTPNYVVLNKHGTAIAKSRFQLDKAGTDIHLENNRQTLLVDSF